MSRRKVEDWDAIAVDALLRGASDEDMAQLAKQASQHVAGYLSGELPSRLHPDHDPPLSPVDQARAYADELMRSTGREPDPRLNAGLLYDVFRVLERHNYARPHDSADKPNAFDEATGRAMLELVHLVEAFEGKEPRR